MKNKGNRLEHRGHRGTEKSKEKHFIQSNLIFLRVLCASVLSVLRAVRFFVLRSYP